MHKKASSLFVKLPSSKSLSNRALILNALSRSEFPVENLSESDDTRVLEEALGFVSGSIGGMIDTGAAGTSFRFLTAYLSQTPGEWILTGNEQMKQRPIGALVEALNRLGAEIVYTEKENYPPLYINGRKLKGGLVAVDGGISSQFISALLMIAPVMEEGLVIRLQEQLVSEPYIRMTLSLMKQFGIGYRWENNAITIQPQAFNPIPLQVESDWSAASYWYEIVALNKEKISILLKGLRKDSLQGDSIVMHLFEPLGIKSTFTEEGVIIEKKDVSYPKRIDYDFIHEPDLVQTLVVTCCLLDIPFCFTGLQSLRIKETDRIEALKQEMKKLGYILAASDSSLAWKGNRCEAVNNPIVSTYNDHRMAMAFAPATLIIKELKIDNPFVVSKSYPYFWEDLRQAGFIIEEER